MFKKLLAAFLAVMMLVSLAACSSDDAASGGSNTDNGGSATPEGFVLKTINSTAEPVELGKPQTALDPQAVYNSLTYTPEMFYGTYQILGGDDAKEPHGKNMPYFTCTIGGEEKNWTKLPFRIEAGKNTLRHVITGIKEYNWMRLYFMKKTESGTAYLDTVFGAYTIEGKTMSIKLLDSFHFDEATNKITYAFSDVTLQYNFAFKGRNLSLSTDDATVTLTTGLDAYGKTVFLSGDCYLSPDSKAFANIDLIAYYYSETSDIRQLSFDLLDGQESFDSIAVMQENGLLTFTLALESGNTTYDLVYFYCEDDGLVLSDGTNVYYYNDSYRDRSQNVLNEYLTEDQTGKLDDLSDMQLEAIVEKKENLMEDLVAAFADAGIQVTVDEKSGELAMDASVLFGGDSAELTAQGKTFLNKFVKAYTSIVFSDKYDGFVSKTMVEGYVAPVSGDTYEDGLPLSEERANNVKTYCLSAETGTDVGKLATSLEAVGYSNSKPVKDADGNVDMAASRRVSFRFIIDLASMG